MVAIFGEHHLMKLQSTNGYVQCLGVMFLAFKKNFFFFFFFFLFPQFFFFYVLIRMSKRGFPFATH